MTTDAEALATELVPLAARLVGTVHEYGPDEVAAVLAQVPAGRHDALAVVLAAMVDPEATPSQLLAWLDGPAKPTALDVPLSIDPGPLDEIAIERAMAGDGVHLTRAERREAVRRLTALGYSARSISDRLSITTRSVNRLRAVA